MGLNFKIWEQIEQIHELRLYELEIVIFFKLGLNGV